MSVEFDRRCGTAQSEDCLQVYIPAVSPANEQQFHTRTTRTTQPTCTTTNAAAASDGDDDNVPGNAEVSAWWPVLSKYHGIDGWPTSAIVLPGEIIALPALYICSHLSAMGPIHSECHETHPKICFTTTVMMS